MSTKDTTNAKGTSLQQFLTPLVLNFIIFAVLVGFFIVLRKKYTRIYEAKAVVKTVPDRRRTQTLPAGSFSWLAPLATEVDTVLLDKAGLDGYLYLKFMFVVCLGGCIVLWPILFPVYATGPGGGSGLDIISLSNISGSSGRFYAAVLMGWIFIGLVCFGILREFRHYLVVRQEYLTSPLHTSTVQATTVLITQIPASHLSESAMRDAFGSFPGGIRSIYFNRDLNDLEDEVENRDKIAYKLEAAQIKLIKTANKLHSKAVKKGSPEKSVNGSDTEQARGLAAKYVPTKKRPSHKLGFLGLLGKKVDTIDWCTSELARLNPKISGLQTDSDSYKLMNSCFVQFNTQAAAQMCYQSIASGEPYAMHPRYIEVAPHDVVWSNMNLTWQMRLLMSTATTAFVCALIIFWAIPVAFVGTLSNITYLTNKVHFLRFILKCPSVLLGLITSYLPTIMLAVLMALLPIILRFCAKKSGIPTKAGIEYAVSNMYYAFLVVQVFLVVTVVSSATAAVTAIIDDPSSAPTILAAKLPTSSNFYISYILLQGLAVSSGVLAQVSSLIVFFLLGKFLDTTPRKKWARWNNLSTVKFGTLFPTYSFLAMITLTYSLIAPLILFFSAFAFFAFYLAYKHNFLYVYELQTSTMGLLYPRALQQTMVGLYFLEVCMIGLVSVGKSYGSIVLMIIALVATVLFHIKLNSAFGPLIDAVPITSASHEPHNEAHATELDDFQSPGRESPFADPALSREVNGDPTRKLSRTDQSSTDEGKLPGYTHKALTAKCPALWIPTDALGVSQDEVSRTRTETKMTVQDSGAFVDEKGNLSWDGKTDPYDFNPAARDVEL